MKNFFAKFGIGLVMLVMFFFGAFATLMTPERYTKEIKVTMQKVGLINRHYCVNCGKWFNPSYSMKDGKNASKNEVKAELVAFVYRTLVCRDCIKHPESLDDEKITVNMKKQGESDSVIAGLLKINDIMRKGGKVPAVTPL